MIAFFSSWMALIALSLPVAFAMCIVAVAYLLIDGHGIVSAAQRLVGGIDSFPLLAVPFFVLAGLLMNASGVADRIYYFAKSLVGHFTGGTGHVNVLGSVIFSGMSGSAVADAGGLGVLEIKAMKEDGFPEEFAGALTCASCIIGPLVPPSIPMVLYAVTANTSVGSLFLAGIVPGLLTAVALMIYVAWWSKRNGMIKHTRAPLGVMARAFQHAFLPLLAPVIIMGGIFGGVFTPTEAAGVAALYSLFLGTVVYRTLKVNQLPAIFREAVAISAVVGMIVAASSLFSWVLAREQVPQAIAAWFLAVSSSEWVFITIVNILLLVMGMFMDSIPIMLLLVPILMPAAAQLGIDPTHMGVLVVMNLMIGILTPPFGVALFTVAKVGNIPVAKLSRAILPMLIPLLVVQVIVSYFPQSFMWLPRMFLN
jgi:tripartite ATP-independent transporter DctM subunit